MHLKSYLEWAILDFDSDAANEYLRLRSLGLRVGTSDLKISAISLVHNATLITRNLGDFRRIPNLRISNWTRP